MYGSNGTMKRIVRNGDNWEEKYKIDITNFLDFDYSMDRRGNKMYYWIIDKVRKVISGQRVYFFKVLIYATIFFLLDFNIGQSVCHAIKKILKK